jgi:hypothetical protein
MLAHFQRLCDELPYARETAAAIESPNPEDDLLIKIGIVGYCYHQTIESWGSDELDFVSRRRGEVEDFDPLWIEFVCFASGYLLGLFQAGELSEAKSALFEAQLPGFMWLHSERFTTS